jgi:hypothetical protein
MVAAWAAAHGLVGRPLQLIEVSSEFGIPSSIYLETSDDLDDIRIEFTSGAQVQIQAKHTVTLAPSSKPMRASIRQWRAAISRPTLDASTTRLVLATSRGSDGIRALGSALERAKDIHPGPSTGAEIKALSSVKKMLGVSDDQFMAFCRMAMVVELPLCTGIGIDHLSIELLDGRVVSAGQAAAAWAALVDYARELARRRAGNSIPGWLDALRKRGIPLIADANASVAARLEAERLGLERHRERLINAARVLDLRGLGVAIPPLPIEIDVRSIRVHALDGDSDNSDRERFLVNAVRRRGHLLLAGPPGSGKSTALAQAAAEWARHSDWPVPVAIKLNDFVRELQTRSPLDALLAAATREVPADDQQLLRAAIERAIRTGDVALFLDALDETRERRFEVVKQLDRLMRHELRNVAELVLSTRDIAYADAATLRLPSLKMAPPRNVDSLIDALLRAIAAETAIDLSVRDEWIRDRQTWVKNFYSGDKTLQETPLMPLLLVLIASESTSSRPPTSRVEILSKIVDNVVRRWEVRQRRTSEVRIGPLESEAATSALLQCFALVGWNLITEQVVRKDEAEKLVASAFRQSWALAPGHAEVAAREALHFWDEAGIYVFSGSEEALSARVALVAEVGAARQLLSADRSSQLAGVSLLVLRKTARTTLSLAMSADAAITHDAIEVAVDRADIEFLLWCAEQLVAGAAVRSEDVSRLASVLLERNRISNAEAWQTAKILCRLPVSRQIHDRLLVFLQALTPSQGAIAEAMMTLRAGEDIANVDLVLSAIGREVRPDSQLSRPQRTRLAIRMPDKDVESFAVNLAERLLNTHPETAELFAAIAKQASSSIAQRLWDLLKQAGRGDLWSKNYKDLFSSMKVFADDTAAFCDLWKKFLLQISTFAQPAQLPLVQKRRLDELADYLATLQYGESIPRDIWNAFQNETGLGWLLQTVAVLGGFDLRVLAAEALVALEMEDRAADSMGFLFDASRPRELLHWSVLPDPLPAVETLVQFVGSTRWVCRRATMALEHTPLKNEAALILDRKFRTYGPYQRLHAAWLITALQPARASDRLASWKGDPDPVLRRLTAMSTSTSDAPADMEWAFADPDASVVADVVDRLGKRPDVELFVDLLGNVASGEPKGWLCMHCGTLNDPVTTYQGCRKCQTSPPDPRRRAQELLKQLGHAFTPPATPVVPLLTAADLDVD